MEMKEIYLKRNFKPPYDVRKFEFIHFADINKWLQETVRGCYLEPCIYNNERCGILFLHCRQQFIYFGDWIVVNWNEGRNIYVEVYTDENFKKKFTLYTSKDCPKPIVNPF
jgi:hypothetical protein